MLAWQLGSESHTIYINTQQMVRVFQNLLDNARRYGGFEIFGGELYPQRQGAVSVL